MEDWEHDDGDFPDGFSLREIEILRHRREGWERLWGKLYGMFGERLDRLSVKIEKTGIGWPDAGTREEFVARLLADYERRFRLGKLLENYVGADGDNPVAYLATLSHVRRRACTFLARERPRVLSLDTPFPGGDEAETRASALPSAPRATAERSNADKAANYSDRRDGLDLALRGLAINIADAEAPSSVEEQAGMQLYPRCDWNPPAMAALAGRLDRLLPPRPPDGLPRDAALRRLHRERRNALREDFARAGEELAACGDDARAKPRELIARMNRCTFEYLLRPLDARTLMDVLSVTRNGADMLRKRYRDGLEDLLRGNPAVDRLLAPAEEPA